MSIKIVGYYHSQRAAIQAAADKRVPVKVTQPATRAVWYSTAHVSDVSSLPCTDEATGTRYELAAVQR